MRLLPLEGVNYILKNLKIGIEDQAGSIDLDDDLSVVNIIKTIDRLSSARLLRDLMEELYPKIEVTREEVKLSREKNMSRLKLLRHFKKMGRDVDIKVIKGTELIEGADKFLLSPYVSNPDGQDIFYVHEAILEALYAKDGKKDYTETLAIRELTLQKLITKYISQENLTFIKAYKKAHKEILKDSDQKELFQIAQKVAFTETILRKSELEVSEENRKKAHRIYKILISVEEFSEETELMDLLTVMSEYNLDLLIDVADYSHFIDNTKIVFLRLKELYDLVKENDLDDSVLDKRLLKEIAKNSEGKTYRTYEYLISYAKTGIINKKNLRYAKLLFSNNQYLFDYHYDSLAGDSRKAFKYLIDSYIRGTIDSVVIEPKLLYTISSSGPNARDHFTDLVDMNQSVRHKKLDPSLIDLERLVMLAQKSKRISGIKGMYTDYALIMEKISEKSTFITQDQFSKLMNQSSDRIPQLFSALLYLDENITGEKEIKQIKSLAKLIIQKETKYADRAMWFVVSALKNGIVRKDNLKKLIRSINITSQLKYDRDHVYGNLASLFIYHYYNEIQKKKLFAFLLEEGYGSLLTEKAFFINKSHMFSERVRTYIINNVSKKEWGSIEEKVNYMNGMNKFINREIITEKDGFRPWRILNDYYVKDFGFLANRELFNLYLSIVNMKESSNKIPSHLRAVGVNTVGPGGAGQLKEAMDSAMDDLVEKKEIDKKYMSLEFIRSVIVDKVSYAHGNWSYVNRYEEDFARFIEDFNKTKDKIKPLDENIKNMKDSFYVNKAGEGDYTKYEIKSYDKYIQIIIDALGQRSVLEQDDREEIEMRFKEDLMDALINILADLDEKLQETENDRKKRNLSGNIFHLETVLEEIEGLESVTEISSVLLHKLTAKWLKKNEKIKDMILKYLFAQVFEERPDYRKSLAEKSPATMDVFTGIGEIKNIRKYAGELLRKTDEEAESSFLKMFNINVFEEANKRIRYVEDGTQINAFITKGILGELAGDIGDACYTRLDGIMHYPSMVGAVIFTKGTGAETEFVGSALILENSINDGEKTWILRAVNANDKFIPKYNEEHFVTGFLKYIEQLAGKAGVKHVVAPVNETGAMSESGGIITAMGNYTKGKPVKLDKEEDFNDIELKDACVKIDFAKVRKPDIGKIDPEEEFNQLLSDVSYLLSEKKDDTKDDLLKEMLRKHGWEADEAPPIVIMQAKNMLHNKLGYDEWKKIIRNKISLEDVETRLSMLKVIYRYLTDQLPKAELFYNIPLELLRFIKRTTKRSLYWTDESMTEIEGHIRKISGKFEKPPIIIEIGAGYGDLTFHLKDRLSDTGIDFISTDDMEGMKDKNAYYFDNEKQKERGVKQLKSNDILTGKFRDILNIADDRKVILIGAMLPRQYGVEEDLLNQTYSDDMIFITARYEREKMSGDALKFSNRKIWDKSVSLGDKNIWISESVKEDSQEGWVQFPLEIEVYNRGVSYKDIPGAVDIIKYPLKELLSKDNIEYSEFLNILERNRNAYMDALYTLTPEEIAEAFKKVDLTKDEYEDLSLYLDTLIAGAVRETLKREYELLKELISKKKFAVVQSDKNLSALHTGTVAKLVSKLAKAAIPFAADVAEALNITIKRNIDKDHIEKEWRKELESAELKKYIKDDHPTYTEVYTYKEYLVKVPDFVAFASGELKAVNERVLNGYKIAARKLGGMVPPMTIIENVKLNIDGHGVKEYPFIIIQKKVKTVKEALERNEIGSSELLEKYIEFNREMWKRGVIEQEYLHRYITNYGIDNGNMLLFDLSNVYDDKKKTAENFSMAELIIAYQFHEKKIRKEFSEQNVLKYWPEDEKAKEYSNPAEIILPDSLEKAGISEKDAERFLEELSEKDLTGQAASILNKVGIGLMELFRVLGDVYYANVRYAKDKLTEKPSERNFKRRIQSHKGVRQLLGDKPEEVELNIIPDTAMVDDLKVSMPVRFTFNYKQKKVRVDIYEKMFDALYGGHGAKPTDAKLVTALITREVTLKKLDKANRDRHYANIREFIFRKFKKDILEDPERFKIDLAGRYYLALVDTKGVYPVIKLPIYFNNEGVINGARLMSKSSGLILPAINSLTDLLNISSDRSS
ncbi:hypothetical protein ACFLTD_03655 [Elusimicrobiota bacterium]